MGRWTRGGYSCPAPLSVLPGTRWWWAGRAPCHLYPVGTWPQIVGAEAGRAQRPGLAQPPTRPSSGVSVTLRNRTAVSIHVAKWQPPGLATGSDPQQACSPSGGPGKLGSTGGPKG